MDGVDGFEDLSSNGESDVLLCGGGILRCVDIVITMLIKTMAEVPLR